MVEDNPDDVLLLCKAFERAGINNPIHVVRSGEDAMAYLSGKGDYSNRAEHPFPDLVLLDLRLPDIDGFGVLKWIRAQPGMSAIRVLVLTASNEGKNVDCAYNLGANSFLVKPMGFGDTIELSRMIDRFWLRASKAPDASRPPQKPPGSER